MSADNAHPKETFTKIGQKLFLNEDLADIHFVFKTTDGKFERVPAHKTLLGAGTPVFRAMFNNMWKERSEVEVVDASANAFKEFLQFFYLMEPEVTMDNVAEVMNLGKKYETDDCFDFCAELLIDNLSGVNVFQVYELAVHLEHKQLEEFCDKYIQGNMQEALASESFLHCDRRSVKRILQMDSLNCAELVCFEALMNWIKVESGQEDLTTEIVHGNFGDLLQEIRFGSMSKDDFFALYPLYGTIFTLEEHREIIQMIGLSQFNPKIFKGNRRNQFKAFHWERNALITSKAERILEEEPFQHRKIESTKFIVNKSALLGAVHCTPVFTYVHSRYHGFRKLTPTTITVIQNSTELNSVDEVILWQGKGELTLENVSRVLLSRPMLIQPGLVYEIQISFYLERKFCAYHCLSVECTLEDISVGQ